MELVCSILLLLLPMPTLFTYVLGFDIPTYSIILIENVFIILLLYTFTFSQENP